MEIQDLIFRPTLAFLILTLILGLGLPGTESKTRAKEGHGEPCNYLEPASTLEDDCKASRGLGMFAKKMQCMGIYRCVRKSLTDPHEIMRDWGSTKRKDWRKQPSCTGLERNTYHLNPEVSEDCSKPPKEGEPCDPWFHGPSSWQEGKEEQPTFPINLDEGYCQRRGFCFEQKFKNGHSYWLRKKRHGFCDDMAYDWYHARATDRAPEGVALTPNQENMYKSANQDKTDVIKIGRDGSVYAEPKALNDITGQNITFNSTAGISMMFGSQGLVLGLQGIITALLTSFFSTYKLNRMMG